MSYIPLHLPYISLHLPAPHSLSLVLQGDVRGWDGTPGLTRIIEILEMLLPQLPQTDPDSLSTIYNTPHPEPEGPPADALPPNFMMELVAVGGSSESLNGDLGRRDTADYSVDVLTSSFYNRLDKCAEVGVGDYALQVIWDMCVTL